MKKHLTKLFFTPGVVDLSKNYGYGDIDNLAEILNRLMMPAFSIAATAVTIYLIIGAVKFLASGGDKNAIEGGKNMIVHAIIGFLLLMMLFLILQFIPQFFGFRISLF